MFLDAFQEYIPFLVDGLIRSFILFVFSLGIVYIFGRMLSLVNSYFGRNFLAIITAFPASYLLVKTYDVDNLISPLELYWKTIIYAVVACMFFVLIGWKLFDRVDHFLDKKFAPDEEENKKARK